MGFFRHERLRVLAMSVRPVTRQLQWATTQHNEMAENEYDVTEHCNTVAVMVHYREAKEIVDPTPPVEPTPNEIRQRALNNTGAPHKFGSKVEYSRDRKARRDLHYKERTGIDHIACARARSVHLYLTYGRNMYIRVREQDQLFQGIWSVPSVSDLPRGDLTSLELPFAPKQEVYCTMLNDAANALAESRVVTFRLPKSHFRCLKSHG